MRKLVVLGCFFLLAWSINAQTVDYDKIIIPKHIKDVEFAEKLVQLAWQNYPQNEIFQNNIVIAQSELSKAKTEWLSKIRIAGNLNEFTLDPDNPRNEFYPRYNFGLMFSLDDFNDIPKDKRIAEQRLKNSQAIVNSQKLFIRSETLKRYETYLLNLEILKVQNEAAQDSYSNYLLIEKRFKDGELKIEEFNKAVTGYNEAKIFKLRAETELKQAKYSLEEIVGVKLEDIL
jgi:outer membrane protein TolC